MAIVWDEKQNKYIVTGGTQQTSTASVPQTQPIQPTNKAFSPQDLPILFNTIKGMIPGMGGAEEIWKTDYKKLKPLQRIGKTNKAMFDEWKRLVTGIPTFLASAVATPVLTGSEALGGPKQVGPFFSYQEQRRQLQQGGAGQVVATGLPVAQEALAALALKGTAKTIKSGLTPKVAPTTPEVAPSSTDFVNEMYKEMTTKPSEALQVKKGLGPIIQRTFKFSGLDDKVSQYGEGGKAVTTLVHRVQAKAPVYNAYYKLMFDQVSKGLDEPAMRELRSVVEGRATSTNPLVTEKANQFRQIDNLIAKDMQKAGIDIQKLENHWPRLLNKEGRKLFGLPQNYQDIMQKFAEAKEMGVLDASKIYNDFIKPLGVGKKAFSEFQRKLTPQVLESLFGKAELPEQFRATPIEELGAYSRALAKRLSTATEWGPKWEKINAQIEMARLASKKGGELATELRDRAHGLPTTDAELKSIQSKISQAIMVNKLSPITGYLQNIFQGPLNSLLRFGGKSAVAGAKSLIPGEKSYGTAGVLDLANPKRGGINDWIIRNVVGMRTEKTGFKWAMKAAENFIDSNFKKLVKNPEDTKAQAAMEGLNINWQDSLKKGFLDPMEKNMGINEGVRQTMFTPFTTSAPENIGLENIFRRYMWQQGKLTTAAPFAKWRSGTAKAAILPTYLALASIAGEPVADIYAKLRGEKRPKNIIKRLGENVTYGPGFWPLDVMRMAPLQGALTSTIAGVPWAIAEQQIRNIYGIATAKKVTTKRKYLIKTVFNTPGVPLGALISRILTMDKK